MYILGAIMYILGANMYILGANMYHLGTNVHPLGKPLKRYSPSDSFCTFFFSESVCL